MTEMCLILLHFLATSEWEAVVSGSTVTPCPHSLTLSISAQAPQTSHQQKPQLCSWQLSLVVRPSLPVTTADQREREINAYDPLSHSLTSTWQGQVKRDRGCSSLRWGTAEVSVLHWLPKSSVRIKPQYLTVTINLKMCTLTAYWKAETLLRQQRSL